MWSGTLADLRAATMTLSMEESHHDGFNGDRAAVTDMLANDLTSKLKAQKRWLVMSLCFVHIGICNMTVDTLQKLRDSCSDQLPLCSKAQKHIPTPLVTTHLQISIWPGYVLTLAHLGLPANIGFEQLPGAWHRATACHFLTANICFTSKNDWQTLTCHCSRQNWQTDSQTLSRDPHDTCVNRTRIKTKIHGTSRSTKLFQFATDSRTMKPCLPGHLRMHPN